MTKKTKIIIALLIITIGLLIWNIGIFNTYNFFTIKKQEIEPQYKVKTIPENAFWIQKNNKGNWFRIHWIHNHKNNAVISIYDKTGKLIKKSKFLMVCNGEIECIENLERKIDFYDGNDIQLKNSNCYLMGRKIKYNKSSNQ